MFSLVHGIILFIFIIVSPSSIHIYMAVQVIYESGLGINWVVLHHIGDACMYGVDTQVMNEVVEFSAPKETISD